MEVQQDVGCRYSRIYHVQWSFNVLTHDSFLCKCVIFKMTANETQRFSKKSCKCVAMFSTKGWYIDWYKTDWLHYVSACLIGL